MTNRTNSRSAIREQRKEKALLKQQEREAQEVVRRAARQREIEDCGNSPLGHVYVESQKQIGRPSSWCVGCHQYEPGHNGEWR